jgi:hypothetical protein
MFSGRFTSNTDQEKIRQKPENPNPSYKPIKTFGHLTTIGTIVTE